MAVQHEYHTITMAHDQYTNHTHKHHLQCTSGFKYKKPWHAKFDKEVHHVSEGATAAYSSSDNDEYVYLVNQIDDAKLPRRKIQDMVTQ
jgi:hypothetical protein